MKTDYQKINTLFMRDEKNIIIPSMMTCPEFEYLKDCKWECTEKIDGANIHIDISGSKDGCVDVSYHGKTEAAEIPVHLMQKLRNLFTLETLSNCFSDQWEDIVNNELTVSIHGEGYGMRIQKGGNYLSKDVGFILFDVRVGNWWLNRENCEDIAQKLNIPIVPFIGYMTLSEAIDYVKTGFKSTIAENTGYEAEGLVLKTPLGLMFRNGKRIITKMKTVDFRKYKAKYGFGAVEQKVNPKLQD